MRKWTSLLVLGALVASASLATADQRQDRQDSGRRREPMLRRMAFLQPAPAPAVDYEPATLPSNMAPSPEPVSVYGPGTVYEPGPPPSGMGMMPHYGNYGPGYPSLGGEPVPMDGCGCELFSCVEYEDLDHVHPCAVKQVVAVPDPCAANDCCGPKCVYVAICAPPCVCPKVKRGHLSKNKIKYDYGDYQVEIESKNGKIYVDYDD